MNISIKSIYDWYRGIIRNPKYRWWVIIGTLIYLISPFDISPDFIPIFGELDDLVIASLLVTELSQLALDSFKSRQNKTASPTDKTETSTVDVDAVSVE